jgi:hypothetical protein
MKKFIPLLTFILSLNAQATECSFGVLDTYSEGLSAQAIKNETGMDTVVGGEVKISKVWGAAAYYPAVQEVKDCVETFKIGAAPVSCKAIFTSALEFSSQVNIPGWSGTVGASDMFPTGYIVPEEVVTFYRNYKAPTSGDYYAQLVKAGSTGGIPGGYVDYFTKMADLAENCNQTRSVPVYKSPDFSPEKGKSFAIVDVYNNGTLSCSFMTSIVDSQIRIEVPKVYHACVKAGDTFLTRIEAKDDVTGLLVTKTAIGGPDEFVSTNKNSAYKVVASEDNNTKVREVVDALDLGAKGINLSSVSQIGTSDIDFDNIASLDPVIFKIVAICEAGVDPANYEGELESWYLAEWNDMAGDVVSADDGNHGGYYRAMYYHQYKNAQTFSKLKLFHADVKNGVITNDDLSNWTNNAMAVCYLNYPLEWIPSNIFDEYIK